MRFQSNSNSCISYSVSISKVCITDCTTVYILSWLRYLQISQNSYAVVQPSSGTKKDTQIQKDGNQVLYMLFIMRRHIQNLTLEKHGTGINVLTTLELQIKLLQSNL